MDVIINGARLNIEVLGGEDKSKPVMIVHHGAPGLGSHAEPKFSFGPFSDEYRVVVFDARGSGASEDKAPFTHDQWAADVDAIREWIGAEKIIMAGGSYGGFISMEYAIRYPDRVLAMVLRDTSAPSQTVEQTLNLTIDPPLSISTTSLPDGNIGAVYNQPVQAIGGIGALTFSIVLPGTGTLPQTLSLNSTTGMISSRGISAEGGIGLAMS